MIFLHLLIMYNKAINKFIYTRIHAYCNLVTTTKRKWKVIYLERQCFYDEVSKYIFLSYLVPRSFCILLFPCIYIFHILTKKCIIQSTQNYYTIWQVCNYYSWMQRNRKWVKQPLSSPMQWFSPKSTYNTPFHV